MNNDRFEKIALYQGVATSEIVSLLSKYSREFNEIDFLAFLHRVLGTTSHYFLNLDDHDKETNLSFIKYNNLLLKN